MNVKFGGWSFKIAYAFVKSCFLFLFVCLFGWLVFQGRVSLYSPGCPGTHSVDHAFL